MNIYKRLVWLRQLQRGVTVSWEVERVLSWTNQHTMSHVKRFGSRLDLRRGNSGPSGGFELGIWLFPFNSEVTARRQRKIFSIIGLPCPVFRCLSPLEAVSGRVLHCRRLTIPRRVTLRFNSKTISLVLLEHHVHYWYIFTNSHPKKNRSLV